MTFRGGTITLDDQHKRNAIGARMANGIVAGLGGLRAQDVRVIVLRAAPGMDVWSAGQDIDELPRAGGTRSAAMAPLERLSG